MVTALVVIVIIVAALLAYAGTRPGDFRTERSTTIKAPPGKIVSFLSDFKTWASWSPYEKLDPAMKKTLAGAPSGKGAVYEWEGNSKAGKGRMEILESTPTKVAIKLDFEKPFEGHNRADFLLQPRGEATEVTWAMYGPRPFIAKLMGLFFDMDKMIGKDFEAGLANLKALAEK